MSSISIALWSTSLTLAVIGISFGIVASINASRANKKIKSIITESFASERAHKLFFEDIKKSIKENRHALKMLRRDIVFEDYAVIASQGRLIPLPSATFQILENSEYKNLVLEYSVLKEQLDKKFYSLIGNLEILETRKQIPNYLVKSLRSYHKGAIKKIGSIIYRYDKITTETREMPVIKKNK